MDKDTMIVTWFNENSRRQECEIFEKDYLHIVDTYIEMIKLDKTCSNIKLYSSQEEPI
jgi:hypothetical protein